MSRRKKTEIAPATKNPKCRGCNSLKTALWVDFGRLNLDKRTKLAKTMRFLKDSLTAHVGGNPTIAQSILIDRLVHLIIRVSCYEGEVLRNPDQGNRDFFLALHNSIRLDLQALGLEGKTPGHLTIEEYLQEKEKKK